MGILTALEKSPNMISGGEEEVRSYILGHYKGTGTFSIKVV